MQPVGPNAKVQRTDDPGRAPRDLLRRREFVARLGAVGVAATAVDTLVAACGGSGAQSAGAPQSKVLRVREDYDLQNVDPAFFPTHVDNAVATCCMEGLVQYKPGVDTYQVVNVLADEFEPSRDGLQYHFKLKRGIPFQKGYGEVTADDVKFSYERIAGLTKPNIHAAYQGDWQTLKEVKVKSKYEGTIVLSKPFAPLMHSTLPVGSGLVLPRKAVEKLGKKFQTNPVGSGPYEFEHWTPQQQITLKKFADYGGAWQPAMPKPVWEEIDILVITQDSAALNAFQAGNVAFTTIPTQSVDQYKSGGQNATFIPKTTLNYGFISMNVQDPLLKNINLRKAIRYAVDVPSLIEAAANGQYTQANAIIPKAMGIGYWADAPRYQRDPEKAKAYLKQSGLGKVSLTISVVNAQLQEAEAQVVQQNLQSIGIDAKIVAQDNATFNDIPGKGGGGPNRQIVIDQYVTEPDPSWSIVWFTCPQVKEWNFSEWCDPAFQKLYNKALVELDDTKRSQIYVEMQKMWDANANVIWTYYPTLFYVSSKSVKPALLPDGSPYFWAFQPA